MWQSLKNIIERYVGQVLIIATISGALLFAYSLWRDSQEERKYAHLIGTQQKYEQLTKYTAKLESDYKSQEELHKKAQQEWAEVSRTKDERIKLLSDATYLIGKHVEKQNGPDYYFETKKRTKNYLLNEIRLQGKDSPAIGYIMIKHDGRTYKRNYKFEVQVKSLQTVDENTGKVRVVSKAFLIQKESSPLEKRTKDYDNWHNKPYPLDIVGGVAYIDPTQAPDRKKLLLWAPRINGGISLGTGVGGLFARPTLSFSTSGYGKSRNDLDWKFLHFGIDTDTSLNKPGVHFLPFSYRFWPALLTNTYIGPGVGFTEDGMNYQLNLNLGF